LEGKFGYTNPEKAKVWRDTVIAFFENSIKIPGPETDRLCQAAKHANAYCVIGVNEQDDRIGSQTLFNTQLFIGRNTGQTLIQRLLEQAGVRASPRQMDELFRRIKGPQESLDKGEAK
jgi:hypothetical protein